MDGWWNLNAALLLVEGGGLARLLKEDSMSFSSEAGSKTQKKQCEVNFSVHIHSSVTPNTLGKFKYPLGGSKGHGH